MGRLAQLRTHTVSLGPCECPGIPHQDGDSAEVRDELGVHETILVSEAGLAAASERGGYNRAAAEAKLIELATVSWSIRDEEGNPTEPSALQIGRLDGVTFGLLYRAAAPALERATAPLSKARGARSAASSQASASPTPTAPKQPTPTTH